MTIEQDIRQRLRSFDLVGLFVDTLGWDRLKARPLSVEADGATYVLTGIAHKRGMIAYLCDSASDLPDGKSEAESHRYAIMPRLWAIPVSTYVAPSASTDNGRAFSRSHPNVSTNRPTRSKDRRRWRISCSMVMASALVRSPEAQENR